MMILISAGAFLRINRGATRNLSMSSELLPAIAGSAGEKWNSKKKHFLELAAVKMAGQRSDLRSPASSSNGLLDECCCCCCCCRFFSRGGLRVWLQSFSSCPPTVFFFYYLFPFIFFHVWKTQGQQRGMNYERQSATIYTAGPWHQRIWVIYADALCSCGLAVCKGIRRFRIRRRAFYSLREKMYTRRQKTPAGPAASALDTRKKS